jgi:hypothetical protein
MKKHSAISFSLVSLLALAGCVSQPDVDTRDQDEKTAAAEPAAVDAAVKVEQAERALEVGRDVAGARAALEAVLADKDAPAPVRDRAALALSRACESLKDTECAIKAVEDLLAAHNDDHKWPGGEAAEKRLRKLLTGKEERDGLRRRHMDKTSAFAHVLAGYFKKGEKKADGKKEPVEIAILTLGGDGHTAKELGTFNVDDALREKTQEECPACDERQMIRSWISQTDSWTSIPAMKARMGTSLVVLYTHAGDPIPARYDSLLPVPMAEVNAILQKGEGVVVAKERQGAPPVILIAAPREAQLAEVEQTLAQMTKLPVTATAVKVMQSLAKEEIQGVMRRQAMPGMKKCYEDFLTRTPGASGRLTLSFEVQAQGEITDLEVTGADALDDRSVKECAAGAMKGVSFPAAGTKTTVKYPFLFTPGD